jgi:cytochrome c oxidase subunit 3
MTTALVILSVLMAVICVWLFRHTINVTPWQETRPTDVARGNGELSMPPVQVGLVVFLAVATSLFALFVSAYYMRMVEADWTNFPLPRVLWINSALLVFASVAMQMTRTAARRGNLDGIRTGLIASGAFSFAFLGGQLWAWRQLAASGEYSPANPAYAFFILLTAVHGIHLLGGMWVLARGDAARVRGVDFKKVRLSVELCTMYWHFLLLVWAALFFVLLNTHR